MALPNYGVFDEKRIFSNGKQVSIIEFNGIKLGLFICEDIWVNDTIVEIDKNEIDLAVSLNASPFDINMCMPNNKKTNKTKTDLKDSSPISQKQPQKTPRIRYEGMSCDSMLQNNVL